MRRWVMAVLAVGLLASPVAAQNPVAGEAQVRVGHFSPGMGDIDLYIDRTLSEAQDLSFATVTPWFTLPAGSYRLNITPAGAPLEDSLLEVRLALLPGQRVTLAVIGERTRGTATLYPLVEDYSPIPTGQARVAFFHAVPDLGPVAVQYPDGTLLFEGLTYPDARAGGDAAAGYFTRDLVAGWRQFQVIPADSPGLLLVQTPEMALEEGTNTLVVLAGLRAGAITVAATTVPGTEVVTVNEQVISVGGGTARVRLAHFATGAGPLTLSIAGEAAGQEATLDFGGFTDWVEVPAAFYTARAVASADGTTTLFQLPEVPLVTGSWVTLAAIGLPDVGGGLFYPIAEDHRPINPGEARLTFVHAMADLGPVDVRLAEGTTLFVALEYPGIDGNALQSVDLVAGPRRLEVLPYGDSETVLFSLPEVTLLPGSNNLVVLTGLQAAPATFLLTTAPGQ